MFPSPLPGQIILPAWAIVLLLFCFWVLAQAASIPFILLLNAMGTPSPVLYMWAMLGIIMISAFVLGLGPVFFAFQREGRDLPDLGILLTPHGWRQWRHGIGIGALYFFAFILVSGLLGQFISPQSTSVPAPSMDWSALMDPGLLVVLVALFVVFAVQSASEEILCRGWALGHLAARFGAVPGVVGASILFAALHPQYFFNSGSDISMQQSLSGIVALFAMFSIGMMLGLLALRDRSIMGAAGLHGAFNFLSIGSALVFNHLAKPDQSIAHSFTNSMKASTQVQGVGVALIVEILLALFMAWAIYRQLPGQKKPET